LDLGLAPGISIKNAMLYVAFSAIAIESAMARNRNVELLPVILPYALLILYAILTWLFIVLFMEDPYYSPRTTLIRLKIKLVDQFLILLVFFYGVINWKDALWLLKALIWVMIIGCLITILDTFNIPDLGIITARDRDGRIEGIIGSAAEFGGLLAFVLPRWCPDDIHRKPFKKTFGNPDLLHRRTIPAVSSNKPGKHFTILIFEQFIVRVKGLINDDRVSTVIARQGRWIYRRPLNSNPSSFGILFRILVRPISIHSPFGANTLFPRVLVQNLLLEHITKSLMPFEAFEHSCFKQCLQHGILISNNSGFLR
jgi:hypothetical protein